MRTSSGTVNINYLFDSAGRWIAFRKRRYVFDRDSRWIGWTPWDDNEVYSPNGSYLGTITYGNRLYCYRERDDRGAPGTIEPPPFPGTYSEPTSPGRAVLLPWANDLDFSWHAELDWSSDLGMDVEQNMIFGHQEDPRSRRNVRPEAYRINEHNLPALDLDTEFSLGSSDRTEVEISAQSRHAVARDDEQGERHSRVHRRYDDEEEDDRNYRSSRSRSRYEDEDDYEDRGYRSRSRGRYDDDEDDYDNRGYRSSRSRSRYEDENDYDAHGYRPRSRGRYDDEDDYDNRGYRSSRPRSRYDDDDDDRGYRPQSRRRYDDEDDYDNRGYRSSRPRSRYDDDDDDDRGYRPQSRRRYEDERDERDSRDRRSRISSRYDDDDDDEGDRYTRRSSDRARRDEDNELDRKREIDRLRLVISKHAKKASESEDDITLLQPLKQSN